MIRASAADALPGGLCRPILRCSSLHLRQRGRNLPAMKTIPESALDWNRRYPPGTLVRVRLRHGGSVLAETAGYAQQWGTLALITLRDTPGLWTAGALLPVAHTEPPPSTRDGVVDRPAE